MARFHKELWSRRVSRSINKRAATRVRIAVTRETNGVAVLTYREVTAGDYLPGSDESLVQYFHGVTVEARDAALTYAIENADAIFNNIFKETEEEYAKQYPESKPEATTDG